MAKKRRVVRPAIRLRPALAVSLLAFAGGLLLLALAWQTSPVDGWASLVWAVPGVYLMAQPLRGVVRGEGDELRIGLRRVNLTGLQKVAVYERKSFGYAHAIATLVWADRVEEISGAFLSTNSFTGLVQWLTPSAEVLTGIWPPRAIAAERPDLVPRRPRR